jgi:hypothetical protein
MTSNGFLNQGSVDYLTPLSKNFQHAGVAGDIDFAGDVLGEFPNQLGSWTFSTGSTGLTRFFYFSYPEHPARLGIA